MSNALCFKCGAQKKEPTRVCGKCMAVPRLFDQLVLSFCLSKNCLKPESFEKAADYFKRKKKPPKFRSSMVNAAAALAEQHAGRSEQSIEFSSAMFEFTDLDEDDIGRRESVSAQVIGRPKGQSDDEPPIGISSKKTCHFETWIVGKDISEEQVKQHVDGDQIFVWYRWIEDRWVWNCISRGKFAQLKAVEDGNPF